MITSNWLVTLEGWNPTQQKWVYKLRYAGNVTTQGTKWINAGVWMANPNVASVGLSRYGGASYITEATASFAPGTTVEVHQSYGDAEGGHDFGAVQSFTTPAAPPPKDSAKTRINDVMIHPTGPCPGMPVANAHAMLCSLNITDTPLSYSPAFGPGIDFTVIYNHQEASQPGTPNFGNLGSKWQHTWWGFVEETTFVLYPVRPAGYGSDNPYIPTTSDGATSVVTAKIALPGGGTEEFEVSAPFDGTTGPGFPLPMANRADSTEQLVKVNGTTYEHRHADGSKRVFGLQSGSRYFLTQIVDREGHAITLSYDGSNRLTTIEAADGKELTLSYEDTDSLKITKVTDPFGRECHFEYTDGRLTGITDVIDLESTFTYSGDFITSMTTPYGTSTFAYGESGEHRWLTLTDPQGGVERLEYHAQISTLPALGSLPTGMLTTSADNQLRYTLYWDKKAMLEAPGNPASAHLYHWARGRRSDVSGVLMDEKRPLESRIVYNYEGQTVAGVEGTSPRRTAIGRVLDDATTQLFKQQFNSAGSLTQAIDPLDRQTDFIYAANGIDLLEVRQKTGSSTYDVLGSYTYDSAHRPLTTTDASGETTTITYNTAGQLRTVTNPKSEVTTFWYHPTGQVPNPTLDPDDVGYLVQVDGAVSGATTKILYDTVGRPVTVTDSEGYAVTTDYDDIDRPTRVTYPDATYEEVTYEKLDASELRDRRGRITKLTYNPVRQIQKVVDPLLRVTYYDWCKCGALSSLTDPAGQTTYWTYDVQSRPTAKIFADGSITSYGYENTTSRLKAITDARGQTTNHLYFKDNALKEVSYTNAVVSTPTVSFTYDAYYPRPATMVDGTGTTSYGYNPVPTTPTLGSGRLASIDGPLANDTITFSYDELGRVLSRSINGSANAASVIYDALGRVSSTTNPLGTFGYDYVNTTGRLEQVTYPNGQVTNYGYFNNAGDQRLEEIENLKPDASNLSTFGYTYDANGVIQTWSRKVDAGSVLTSTFGYDAADQLTGAAVPTSTSVTKNYVYGYSRGGNRTSEQIDNAVLAATHNSLNQLTALSATGPIRFEGTLNEPANVTVNGTQASLDAGNTFQADLVLAPGTHTVAVVATDGSSNTTTRNYEVTVASGTGRNLTYDGNGNLTNNGAGQTYTWDAANRLISITQGGNVTEFVYDGLGRRVKEKLNASVIKQWIWCDGAQPDEERDGSNTVTKRFFAQGQLNGTTPLFYTFDHLGSVREAVDDQGAVRARYEYDAFGRATKVNGDLEADFGYTGFYRHQASELNLTLYRAYDPVLGRWLSRDPLEDAELLPEGPNLYTYVGNDPINAVDSLGLYSVLGLEFDDGKGFWENVGDYAKAAGSGAAQGGSCWAKCMAQGAGIPIGAAGIGLAPMAPIPKAILPNVITRGGGLGGMAGKSGFTSAARVFSVATRGSMGSNALANAIKQAPVKTAGRLAGRAGAVGAAALSTYCAYKCSQEGKCNK